MIGRLKGEIVGIEDDHITLDVHGVGYEVYASTRTLSRIGGMGDMALLQIETVVREDAITLYGFQDSGERACFRLLQTVQGVGTRVALGILSIMDPGMIEAAIARGDKAAFSRASGVGPKLAQRLVMELKDKVAAFAAPGAALGVAAQPASAPGPAQDCVSALINLGYKQVEAQGAVARVLAAEGAVPPFGTLMRLALAEVSK